MPPTTEIKLRFNQKIGIYEITGCDKKISALVASFLDSLRVRGLSTQTLRAYGYDTLHLVRWLETANRKFRSLNQAMLLEWVSAQRDQNAKPKSINRRLSVCHIFYRFCFNQEIKTVAGASFPSSMAGAKYDDIGLPIKCLRKSSQLKVKVPRPLIEALEPEDVGRFMGEFARYRDLAILLLMLLCGLRSCEVLALRMNDLNFIDRTMRVRGKGGKERMLPLLETVNSSIRRYLRYERPQGLKKARVFVVLQGNGRGQPMTTAGLRSIFRARRRSTGIVTANPHKFRHCFGTEMARAGVQLPVLREMMGHSNIKITLQYIQLSMADIASEYERAIVQINSRYEKS